MIVTQHRRRAVTIVDVVIASSCGVALCAIVGASAAALRPANGAAISMANTMQIGMAHALYAWDHDGKQWCTHQSNFGDAYGNCSIYVNTIACPPQVLLGWDQSGGMWGYWLSGAQCPAGNPSTCGNWIAYSPNEFGTTNGGFGGWSLLQTRGFHDYLNGRFYDPVYYAPNDAVTYRRASPNFDTPAEYAVAATPIFSSYAMSAAAMWHPDVLRAPAAGGYRPPSQFADAYD